MLVRMTARSAHSVICPDCQVKMRLVGVEKDARGQPLLTYECEECEAIEVRPIPPQNIQ